MAKPVTESAKIVVRTDAGNRMEISGKGDAADAMLTAFMGFGMMRREKLMADMAEAHAKMLRTNAEITGG